MRKITKESAKAFVNFKPYKKDNTEVLSSVDKQPEGKYSSSFFDSSHWVWFPVMTKKRISGFYLHGNRIAFLVRKEVRQGYETKEEFSINIDLCGYHTRTTRERINGVLDALGYDFRVAQRNHEQVLVRRRRRWRFKPNGENSESYVQDILKLSDDSFDPDFAKRVFNSKEFVSGTDLNAITDF